MQASSENADSVGQSARQHDRIDVILDSISKRFCQKNAVVDPVGNTITYGELSRRAAVLAGRLQTAGVSSESLVGLCADRSIDAIVGMLAILKAGGAYVPIDPAYPRTRIELIIADSKVDVVVTTSRVDCAVLEANVTLIYADDDAADLTTQTESSHDASDLAYVIYTSGSTGKPKGVLVEHRNVSRLVVDHARNLFQCGPDDSWLWFHSIGFDFSVWEIWGALLLGGTLIIASYEQTRSPKETLALIRRHRVTVLNQTPSAFRQLDLADLTSGQMSDSLRLVIFGGEALDATLLRPWIARYGDIRPRLVNMYGITETCVHVTHKDILESETAEVRVGSAIGIPLPDLDVQLLDNDLRPVPMGYVGEMFVSGAGLARGYVGAQELTNARFPQLHTIDGQMLRFYRSGDLARRSENGELIYMGRSDDQMKIRGFRIEPKEVESVVLSAPKVHACVVKAQDYGEGDVRLVAFVVPEMHAGPERELIARLTRHAAERLPVHMRPSAFFVIAEVPLTEHGKVDRARLEPPIIRKSSDSEGDRSMVEQIWADVLGTPDAFELDFFDAGGTSLALIRMLTRLNAGFGSALDPSQLLDGVTVDNILKCIQESNAADSRSFETV